MSMSIVIFIIFNCMCIIDIFFLVKSIISIINFLLMSIIILIDCSQ